jgi:hypothetical protein
VLNLADIAKIADTPFSLDPLFYKGENGRAGEIRTHDLLHPMQAFYQAELRPDLFGTQRCAGPKYWMGREMNATAIVKIGDAYLRER